MNKLLSILCFVGLSYLAAATGTEPTIMSSGGGSDAVFSQKEKYPAVFLINDNPSAFEKLTVKYSTPLLGVCNYDMDSAYVKWIDFIVNVEEFATENDFDIKGVKMWIKVFWNKEGKIEHIAYHLKPKSRNINTDSLSDFFERFITEYQFPLTAETGFSHYAVASYPTFYRPVLKE